LAVKATPTPWLSISGVLPFRWSWWSDRSTGEARDLGGLSDPALSASFDLLELVHPNMIRTRCPETGGTILALKDDGRIVQFPHLFISAGLVFPAGEDAATIEGKTVSPQFQPGSGLWSGNVGLHLSEGFGPVNVGVGAAYAFSRGANAAGYDPPDTITVSAALTWLAFAKRLGKVYLGTNIRIPLGEGAQRQSKPGSILEEASVEMVPLEGSDQVTVQLDVGYVMWIGSYWKKRKKLFGGVLASFPLVEGESDTEPRVGYGAGLFFIFNI
jgi:hypothetical protein